MYYFKSLAILGAFSVATAGCAGLTEIESEPQDVGFTQAEATKNIHRFSPTAIRTFSGSKFVTENEISGIPCTVQGNGYRAKVVTPAIVKLPTYLGKTDPILVACGTESERVVKKVAAVNLTEQSMRNTPVGVGGIAEALVAIIVVETMTSARNPAKDQFSYGNVIHVDMSAN